jgi:hypothetical protein
LSQNYLDTAPLYRYLYIPKSLFALINVCKRKKVSSRDCRNILHKVSEKYKKYDEDNDETDSYNKIHGEYKERYDNGKLKIECFYIDGIFSSTQPKRLNFLLFNTRFTSFFHSIFFHVNKNHCAQFRK